MSNMSYCRFQNTLSDFCDCADWLEETLDTGPDSDTPLSQNERRAACDLLDRAAKLLARVSEANGDGGKNAFALPNGDQLEDYDWASVVGNYCV